MQETIQTLAKGVIQGVKQFIANDLETYLPLFVIAGVLIVFVLLKDLIQKIRNKNS